MQATVSRFDATVGDGAVLLDDGRELTFAADALIGTGLRLLRPGQRVRLELAGSPDDPAVRHVQILTLR